MCSSNMNFKKLDINCNDSGTTARLMCGYLAGLNIDCTIKGSDSLSKRPMKRIVGPLKNFGVNISCHNETLPIEIRKNNAINSPFNYILKLPSAQIKSALILYALSIKGISIIKGEIKTRDHLERLLLYLKYPIKIDNNKIMVTGGCKICNKLNIRLPGDISSASFLIAATILLKDSKLIIRNIGLNQHRMGFINTLIKMGASIQLVNNRYEYGELVGDIKVKYSNKLQGVTIKSSKVPCMIDEIPILCVVAAFSNGETNIKGVNELKHKESNRIKAIIQNFKKMNGKVEYKNNILSIKPEKKMYNTSIESFGDHRIFMSFYIANLALGVFYSDSLSDKCYDKSFKNFIDIMKGTVCENF